MNKPDKKEPERLIAENRRARYDYFIEERLEAGLVLQGWEVKSMRAGKAQVAEAYVYLKEGEAFLFGANITPLKTASTPWLFTSSWRRKLWFCSKTGSSHNGRWKTISFGCLSLLRVKSSSRKRYCSSLRSSARELSIMQKWAFSKSKL